MSYFQAVRAYSLIELSIFTALLVFWIGGLDESVETTLGWTHGIGWIGLCLAVGVGCLRRVFPWPVLAATVSPLGPVGSTAALEYLARTRPLRDVPDQSPQRPHAAADPAGAGPGRGADRGDRAR